MRQLDYDYLCDSTPAMGFHLIVVNDYSRGLGSGTLCAVKELLVELATWGGVCTTLCSGARRPHILAGHQWGVGVHARGHTDCVQEGASPEEVLWRVDDGVTNGVEHLDGWVSLHRAWRGACT